MNELFACTNTKRARLPETAASGIKSALKVAFTSGRQRQLTHFHSYPIARCTHGFNPGTRARRTPAFTSHGLLLRKRMKR